MMPMIPYASSREPFCIRCLCTESKACVGGCAWRYFNRKHRIGICSRCTTHRDERVRPERRETREQLKGAVDRYIKSARQEFEARIYGRPGEITR